MNRRALHAIAPLLLVGPATLTGCYNNDPASVRPPAPRLDDPNAPLRAEDLDRQPAVVRPEWTQFVMANYRGVLLADLGAASNIRFLEPPTIFASANRKTGATELSVTGELDANAVTGERHRRNYIVAWRQAGGGWDLILTRVDPGAPLSAPPVMLTPTSRPATGPVLP